MKKSNILLIVSLLIVSGAQAKDKQEALKTTKQHSAKHLPQHLQKLAGTESHPLISQWAPLAEQVTMGADASGNPLTADQIKNLMTQADALAIKIVEKINMSKNKAQEESQVLNEIKEFLNNVANGLQEELKNAKPDADKEYIARLNVDIARFKNAIPIFGQIGLKGLFYDTSKYPAAPAQPAPAQKPAAAPTTKAPVAQPTPIKK